MTHCVLLCCVCRVSNVNECDLLFLISDCCLLDVVVKKARLSGPPGKLSFQLWQVFEGETFRRFVADTETAAVPNKTVADIRLPPPSSASPGESV